MRLEAETVVERTDLLAYVAQHVELRRSGQEFVGLCPFHKERTPSFSVNPGKRIWKCFGCDKGGDVIAFAKEIHSMSFQDALQSVADFSNVVAPKNGNGAARANVAPARAIPEAMPEERRHTATYRYQNAEGAELFQVWRFEPGRNGRKKDFSQVYTDETGQQVWKKHPHPVLYRLPEVLAAAEVVLVEGEKDADTVREKLGMVGTTPPGGSSAGFDTGMVEALAGRRVFLVPDNDAPGEKRARQITEALKDKAEVIVVRVKSGKDITDWVEAEGAESVLSAIATRREEADREKLRGLLSVEQILARMDGGYQSFCDPRKRSKGLQSGFRQLDELTWGMFPGDLIVLAARPAMGKTAFAMNIALNVAKQRKPVTVFSLEMTSEQLLTRMVCGESLVSSQAFRMGHINRDEISRFRVALDSISRLPIFVDDFAAASAKYIRQQVEKAPERPALVVIDYLGLMHAPKAENRVQQVSATTREMKLLAKDFRIPVILVAQLNRSTETRPTGGNVPQLSDLRESGSIEQDADMVWFVYRPEYYKPDREDLKGLAEILVAKQRNGPTGKASLAWLGHCTRFMDLAREEC